MLFETARENEMLVYALTREFSKTKDGSSLAPVRFLPISLWEDECHPVRCRFGFVGVKTAAFHLQLWPRRAGALFPVTVS